MNISLTETQWNTVWTLVKSCIDSTDDPKSAAHYERILRRLENPKTSAHIKELEAQLAAAKEAFSEFDKSKWQFTTGDGTQAYQKLFDALSK